MKCGAAELEQGLWQVILNQLKVAYVKQQPARAPSQPLLRAPVEGSLCRCTGSIPINGAVISTLTLPELKGQHPYYPGTCQTFSERTRQDKTSLVFVVGYNEWRTDCSHAAEGIRADAPVAMVPECTLQLLKSLHLYL